MTGGRVVVLGPTGRNFAAGMSGGIAYVYDPDGEFAAALNTEMVDARAARRPEDAEWLHGRSPGARRRDGFRGRPAILADWARPARRFVKVMPRDYKRVLQAIAEAERDGTDRRQGDHGGSAWLIRAAS